MSLMPHPNNEILEDSQKQQILDANDYRNQSKAPKSLITYQCAWKKFTHWCKESRYNPFNPPNGSYEFLAALFISSMAKGRKLKDASITCYLAGIRHFYGEKGVIIDTTHQEIRKIRAGIKRELGTKQTQKLPLTTENIKLLIDSIGKLVWPIEVRDKAMILLGFAGAFRRSELVGIDLEHLAFDQYGVSVFIPKSKTDQEMQGRVVDIPFASNAQYCPVRALKDWIRCARIEKGAIFLQVHKGGNIIRERLGDRSVALMLKRRCKPFGFADDIAGHSLRAGHVTSAIKNGTPETWIMRQTGHTSIDTLRKYERLKREFEANSAARIGL
ncbi:MAG: site-specific integrase [Chlamydiia bacterium]|nr:site-specific integrase [Chlamydiia bacterium]